MKLYGYFRSSAAYRVRIALNLKGLAYDQDFVHLTRGGGQQFDPNYLRLNPAGLVPTLVDGPAVLTQSLAIIEYLEEAHPEPPLLPVGPVDRARVRAIAYAVACEIHPVNNLRILDYLRSAFGADDAAVTAWFRHWVAATFAPLEAMLAGDPRTGRFCHGDRPGLADICFYAQALNNRRFGVDMEPYPTIRRIFDACAALPAFIAAAPENQPDAE